MMGEIDKNVLYLAFTRNEVSGTHLVFEKRRFQGFTSEILGLVKSLRRKVHFVFNSLGTTEISRACKHSFYIISSCPSLCSTCPIQNNLNHASTSNIREVMKFSNLGDRSFETDFSPLLGVIQLTPQSIYQLQRCDQHIQKQVP